MVQALKHVNYRLDFFRSSRNSSLVKPASAIISSSRPLFISLCLGTGTMYSSLTSIMWLPLCLAAWKPALVKALTTLRQDSKGSFDNYLDLLSFDPILEEFCFNL